MSKTSQPQPAQSSVPARPATPKQPEATKRLTAKEMFDSRKADISSSMHDSLKSMMNDIESSRGGIDVNKALQYMQKQLVGSGKITPEQWTQEGPKVKAALEWAVLSQIAEGRALDKFKEAKVEAAKNSSKFSETLKKAKGKIEEIFGKGKWFGFVGALFSLLKLDPKKGTGKFLASLIGYKPTKEENQTQPDKTPAEIKEAAAKVKKYKDIFSKHTPALKLDENKVMSDIALLSKNGLAENDIEKTFKEAFGPTGNLTVLNTHIAKATNNKPFTYRLADLQLQKMPKDKADKVQALWLNPKNTIPKTPEGIRTFMDALHTDFNKALADYMKPLKASATATGSKTTNSPETTANAPDKTLRENVDRDYKRVTDMVSRACDSIIAQLDIIVSSDGSGLLIGGRVKSTVAKTKKKINVIKNKIAGIKRTIAANPTKYRERLALLKQVKSELIRSKTQATSKGVSSMLSSKGQAAQRKILDIMEKADTTSKPLFAAIETNTSKIKTA